MTSTSLRGARPCPGFSNIGRSKIISLLRDGGLRTGLGEINADELRHTFIQDPRNELFLEFVKYVEHFEPRWFIMENVPGMLTSKIEANGRVLKIVDVVKKAFSDIGYQCEVEPLWANDYGVPQTRQRVIFLGWKNEKDKITHPARSIKKEDITSVQAIDDLPFMGQNGGPFATYGGSMSETPNRYQKSMRYEVYKNAKRPDPRTEKIPTGKEPLTCHVGRKVNPRDRSSFQN